MNYGMKTVSEILHNSWEGRTGISGTGFSSLLEFTGLLLEFYWIFTGMLLDVHWNLLDFAEIGFSENPVPEIPVGPGHRSYASTPRFCTVFREEAESGRENARKCVEVFQACARSLVLVLSLLLFKKNITIVITIIIIITIFYNQWYYYFYHYYIRFEAAAVTTSPGGFA